MFGSFGFSKLPFVAHPALGNTAQYQFLPTKLFHVLRKRITACSPLQLDFNPRTEGRCRSVTAPEPRIPEYAWQILARARQYAAEAALELPPSTEAGAANKAARSISKPKKEQGKTRQSRNDRAAQDNDRKASHAQASTASTRVASALIKTPILDDSVHSIRPHDIPRGVWTVLLRLRGAGHEGYLVGGAVRDLLVDSRPKDFDIVTTATPVQVKRLFGNCRIIGKKFPIAQVFADSLCLEVSSFGTRANRELIPPDAAAFLPRHLGHSKGGGKGGRASPRLERQPDTRWATARLDNVRARDFTVNSILYDPFAALLYDYAGGFRDCQRRVLRTVIDAETSFQEDPARILRAVRHAARVGLSIDDKTGQAMRKYAGSVVELPMGRLLMEAQALFSYGSAAQSLRLLWRYRLLEVIAPTLAARFKRHRVPRNPQQPATELTLQLMEHLDHRVHPQHPVDWTAWCAMLVAPLVTDALEQARKPTSRSRTGTSAKKAPETGEPDEDKAQDGACPVCQHRAREKFRDIVDDCAQSLLLPGQPGQEVKGIVPAAQWKAVVGILMDLTDASEFAELPEGTCAACQERLDKPGRWKGSGSRKESRALIADLLKNVVSDWSEARDAVLRT